MALEKCEKLADGTRQQRQGKEMYTFRHRLKNRKQATHRNDNQS